MKKLNHRTKVVILTVVIFLLLAAIYACGILIPDDAITGSFSTQSSRPALSTPSARMPWDATFSCARSRVCP